MATLPLVPTSETLADKTSILSLYMNIPQLVPPHPYYGITFWSQNIQVHPAWFIYLGMTSIKYDSVDWVTLDHHTGGQVRRALWDAINIACLKIRLDHHIASHSTLAYEDIVFFMTIVKINSGAPLDTRVYSDFPHILTNRWMIVNMAGYVEVIRPPQLIQQATSPVISSTTSATSSRAGAKRQLKDQQVPQSRNADQ